MGDQIYVSYIDIDGNVTCRTVLDSTIEDSPHVPMSKSKDYFNKYINRGNKEFLFYIEWDKKYENILNFYYYKVPYFSIVTEPNHSKEVLKVFEYLSGYNSKEVCKFLSDDSLPDDLNIDKKDLVHWMHHYTMYKTAKEKENE